jgi:ATP-dependent DNA helicase RecG
MYDTPDDLLREILAGEDSFLDCKEVFVKGGKIRFAGKTAHADEKPAMELAKDLTCFANTEGGVIVFGVRKDKERVGIPENHMEALQREIVNAAQNNIEPPLGHLLVFDRVFIQDSAGVLRLCLKLEIKKALYSVHAPRGRRPYWRIADHCHEMTLEQQARVFERRGMMLPFEERTVFGAMLRDINTTGFLAYYEMRYGSRFDPAAIDLERLLQNLKLAVQDETGTLHPTGLGLLLFSSRPDRWIAGAFVDLVVYGGTVPDADTQKDAKNIHGPIVEQIERTMDYLRLSPYLPTSAEKNHQGRLEHPAYSLRALQEAVVNALVHRDYSALGSQVRLFIFPDRIEISNPGRLHNTLQPADLFAGCQPVRRNQMLAGFLREYVSPITQRSYMEGRGEGFLTMVRECERISGKRPDLEIIGDSVRLTIWGAFNSSNESLDTVVTDDVNKG